MTAYVILSEIEGSPQQRWEYRGEWTAHNADAALHDFASDAVDIHDFEHFKTSFVVIPARYWKPRTVEVKTETRVRVLDVTETSAPSPDEETALVSD